MHIHSNDCRLTSQVMYSLLDYGSPRLREMEKACQELGITVVAYATLGQVYNVRASLQ